MSTDSPSPKNRQNRKQRKKYVSTLNEESELQRKKSAIEQQIRHRRRRRYTAYLLFVLAGLTIVSHLLTHAGAITIIADRGLADILIGYPTGGVLGVAGLMLLPAQGY
jgi:ferric-dicitrate binding protein FerR (iron transport regulator)